MTHWFFSLSTSQVLGLVFFGSLVAFALGCCIVSAVVDIIHRRYRNYVLTHSDEFAFSDDPFAVLCYSFDAMKDDIHVEHAKEILQKRAIAGAPQMYVTNSTCLWCRDVENCPFSFDPYCMDGDCLMTK